VSNKTEAGPVAQDWLKARIDEEMAEYSAGAYADHGSARDQLALFAADLMLAAHPPAQEQPAPYFNRQAVERAISSAENPAPGTMQLNDGKERVTLPGGTLRRMLAIIDQLATHPTPAERATLKGQP